MVRLQGLTKSPIYKKSVAKVTDRIVYYRTIQKSWGDIEHNFYITDIKSKKLLGIMTCFPSKVYRRDLGEVNSLYIAYINAVKNMGQGVGSALFNLAKIHSKRTGCGGNIYLDSSGCILPNKAPHTFYRKMGMNTGIKWIDNVLDGYNKSGKYLQKEDFPLLRMHYPPIDLSEKSQIPLYRRIFMHIKDYFTIKH